MDRCSFEFNIASVAPGPGVTEDFLLADVALADLTARPNRFLGVNESVSRLPTVDPTDTVWTASQDIDAFEVLDTPQRVYDAIGRQATVSVFRSPQR